MKWLEIGLYALLGLIVLITAIKSIVKTAKRKKEQKQSESKQAEGVVEKGGVRYSHNAEIVGDSGELNVSYVKQDVILQPRKMVVVDKKGVLKPGKYTVLSAYENEESFNIRIGLYVKEYKHGQEIVLAEGEEVCPTSSTIILR